MQISGGKRMGRWFRVVAALLALAGSVGAASAQNSTAKLLSFHFDEGRPRLSPEEEAAIRLRASAAALQEVLHNPAATLIVVGYLDRAADRSENRKIVFRRAQIIVDLLRDKCGAVATLQVVVQRVKNLPLGEQQEKQRSVEVWMVSS